MAMRAAAVKSQVCLMESSRKMIPRYFSSDGRVFSEEEKAAENIYIKKMERERIEKAKKKLEKEKAAADKDKSDKFLFVYEDEFGRGNEDNAYASFKV
ncbi:hypothetical protein IFM89_031037 [Coptis chinensis]|uniref:ATPase inhibitor n=1 Tax=Coptis chinensis TaxID=261450 RepID=A0A835H8R4_9MAGN|nr:hypothetical protein IFM89_031037 [Coptis chinensis]